MIRRIAEKIKDGTKFFLGHGDNTNAHQGRQSVGEVVSSFVKEIGGRLSHIIIGHFPDENKVRDMDVCSMEADVYTDTDNLVGDINEISGIALGSSDVENPAFPGAFRLGTVQCFDDEGEKNKSRKEKIMALTFEEVKEAVRSMNIHPWQLYSIDDIKNDRIFSKSFTELESLRNENVTLKKEKGEIEEKSKEAIRQADVVKAKSQLDTHMEDLTDKQKKFITKRFDPTTMEDLSENGLKKFVEDSKKEFAETAKLFGDQETVVKDSGSGEEETSSGSMEEEALKTLGVKPNG